MKCTVLIMCVLGINLSVCKAQLALNLEGGAVQFGYNNVRIAGNNGTLFSLTEDLHTSTVPYFRARLQYDIGKRHSVSLLYAPLTLKSNGTFNRDVLFNDQLFLKGQNVNCSWKFNSYRITYQYNIVARENITIALGITGKIRDASIRLETSGMATQKTNVGFVPLIRFYADWKFIPTASLILDGDALAANQGRAEDISLSIGYHPTQRLTIKAGYRLLEGGADNNEVYNFSSVNYAMFGIGFKFW